MVSDKIVGGGMTSVSLFLLRLIQVLSGLGGFCLILAGLMLAGTTPLRDYPDQMHDWGRVAGAFMMVLWGIAALLSLALWQGLAVFFEMAANQAASARAFERMAEFLAGPESPSARTEHPAP